ncbi:MAG: peptide-methionine (S)-S-oxide reductase MsrA [Comamonadaceae bacterium]|jgi:peptide-methionine (S)-S-oxide reductase|nr:peptide-methionine (S)-S-oxide reductase MsrA [Comamonadaceae bacterium]
METVVLGGGCFWCTHAVFTLVRGVLAVESGYANGRGPQPTYEQVCQGDTGYVEVVRVQFDPAQVSLEALLEIFMAAHDPTQRNRQGHDVGTQYRSGIYCTTPMQEAQARAWLQQLQAQRRDGAALVTEVEPLRVYWPAEDYHQDYFARQPEQRYCALVVQPKRAHVQALFAARLHTAH